jgi:hypothetical protein
MASVIARPSCARAAGKYDSHTEWTGIGGLLRIDGLFTGKIIIDRDVKPRQPGSGVLSGANVV